MTTSNITAAKPENTPTEILNTEVVTGFFNSFTNGTLFQYIDENFAEDVSYEVISPTGGPNNAADVDEDSPGAAERNAVVQFTGLKQNPAEVQDFFIELLDVYNVLDFRLDNTIIAEDSKVFVTGALTYEHKDTGTLAQLLPLAVQVDLEDGKFSEYLFREDSFAFAGTTFDGGEWSALIDGQLVEVNFGTTDDDTLSGSDNNNLTYGYQGDDVLETFAGADIIWGGAGNDFLDAGADDDELYGGEGNNTLEGGAGNDQFAIGRDQGFNTITDFTDGEDTLGLTGSLTFDQLDIESQDGGVAISLADGDDPLALLSGISADAITQDDFFEIPNTERTTATNEALVAGFFQSFLESREEEYIDANFHPNITYKVVEDQSPFFGAEREAHLTHSGIYEGTDGAKFFFDLTRLERTVLAFDLDEVIGSGDSVAAFGSFRYRAPEEIGGSGNIGETDWAVKVEVLDGQIYNYTFFENSLAVSALYRFNDEGIQWRRTVDGQVRDIMTGSDGDDTLTPISPDSENFIFGYAGDDTIIGGNLDDALYGGIGQNTLTGNGGADRFVIAEGAFKQPTNRYQGIDGFTFDTITDFTQGEDTISLTYGLTFGELEFSPDGEDLQITVTETGETIAALQGVTDIELTAADFETLPAPAEVTQVAEISPELPDGYYVKSDPFGERPDNLSQDNDANIRLIENFLNNFQADGYSDEFIAANVHPEAQLLYGGSESDFYGAEAQALLPYLGVHSSIEGFQNFFGLLGQDIEVLDFTTDEVYGGDGSIAAFGTYRYLVPATGDIAASEWSLRAWIIEEDGQPQIYRVEIGEDTAAVAHAYRLKEEDSPVLEWAREFAGAENLLTAGTNADEVFEGRESLDRATHEEDEVQLNNKIFAYGGDDVVTGNAGNDLLYGGDGDDTLDGLDGKDDIYGGPGDDIIQGGEGDDNLYGNQGDDEITGGSGSDLFVLRFQDGSDTITDYTDGEDKLGLLGLLTFEDVEITQVDEDAVISVAATGETLATLLNTDASQLTSEDFTKRSNTGAEVNPTRDLDAFPEFGFGPNYPVKDAPLQDVYPSEVDEELNRQLVIDLYEAIEAETVTDSIETFFAEGAEYVLNAPTDGPGNTSDYFDNQFTDERQYLLPHSGLHKGTEAIQDSFRTFFNNFEVSDLRLESVLAQGDDLAVSGRVTYLNTNTGVFAEDIPFGTTFRLQDGKIVEMLEFNDSFAIAATTRLEGELASFWAGDRTDIQFGSPDADTLVGEDGTDLIYGYRGSDTVAGGLGDDILFGLSGDDVIRGDENSRKSGGEKGGDDKLYGGDGDDRLGGKGGDDQLFGEDGDDLIWGDDGDDILEGGLGNDTLTGDDSSGGQGSDIFVLAAGEGTDTITDFQKGEDAIGLKGDLEFSQLVISQGTGTDQQNTFITVATSTNELLAILENQEAALLGASDFLPNFAIV